MRNIILPLLVLFFFSTVSAQIVTVKTSEKQRSTFRWGSFYYSDALDHLEFNEMTETKDGFFKIGLMTNNGYTKKNYRTLHISKLDKSLQITEEFTIDLKDEETKSLQVPVALIKGTDKLHLICDRIKDGQLELVHWVLKASDLSVVSQNEVIASFEFASKKAAHYNYSISERTGQFAIAYIQESGKESCNIHSILFSRDMKKEFIHSQEIPVPYFEELITSVHAAGNGRVWSIINGRIKKSVTGSFAVCASKGQTKLVAFRIDDSDLFFSEGVVTADDKFVMAGLKPEPGGKAFSALQVAEISETGKINSLQKLAFNESFTKEISEDSRQASGISTNFLINKLLQRKNGTIDIIFSYVRPDFLYWGGIEMKIHFGDIAVASLKLDKTISTTIFNRNITDRQVAKFTFSLIKYLSISNAFTDSNNLYLMFMSNPENIKKKGAPGEVTKIKMGNAVFSCVRVAENEAVSSQILYEPEEDFISHLSNKVTGTISRNTFFGYYSTEWGMTSKANVTFSILKVK